MEPHYESSGNAAARPSPHSPKHPGSDNLQLVDMRRRVHKELRLRFGVDSQLLVAVFPKFDPLSPLSGSRAAGEPRIEVLWLGSSKAGEN